MTIYDPRGNLVEEMGQEGRMLHGYAYDAGNRLERAWNEQGEEAAYLYNGMGQRVEKRSGSQQEEYILDFTKPYHNLLGIQRGKERESFYWDFTPIATQKEGSSPRYYLLDELGSPLRVQYATGRGECYGYDEFGRDLAEEKREVSQEGFKSPYVKQETTQPFGYTGYRYDGISGSYFAQARECQPHTGRFMAENVIRGRITVPKTLNRYGYCLSNPFSFIDPSGMVSEQEAQSIITENAQFIFDAAEEFDVDPYVLAGCIYVEQIENVDLKDEFDATLVLKAGFDSSVGIGQIKVSTAKLLQEEGYMPYTENPTFWERLFGMTREAKIAFELEDNETNIYYAAAYLNYLSNEWADEYPDIWGDVEIQGTLYNLGHEKIKDNFMLKILGTLFEGFKDDRIPHSSPGKNEFGESVLENYQLMKKLLGEETCEN